jgi:hypothetical protein
MWRQVFALTKISERNCGKLVKQPRAKAEQGLGRGQRRWSFVDIAEGSFRWLGEAAHEEGRELAPGNGDAGSQ